MPSSSGQAKKDFLWFLIAAGSYQQFNLSVQGGSSLKMRHGLAGDAPAPTNSVVQQQPPPGAVSEICCEIFSYHINFTMQLNGTHKTVRIV